MAVSFMGENIMRSWLCQTSNRSRAFFGKWRRVKILDLESCKISSFKHVVYVRTFTQWLASGSGYFI